MINLKQKKFLLVSNITDHSGPTEGLTDFLTKNSSLLVTIYHPFYYCQGKRSKVNLFKKGKLISKAISPPLALPEFLKYLVDLFLTFYYTLKFKNKFDFYLGINCLHALVGIVYRKLGLVNKVIFYTIDWTPHRFKNPFYNWLYFKIDYFSRQNADFVWNLSEKITQIRKDQGIPNHKNLFVPNGVNFQNIKKPFKSQIKKEVLVLLGALHPDKGVDLVIKAMPKIWQKFPQIKLVVIGNTPKINKIKPYEKILSSLDKRITVLGSIPHQKVLSILPKMGIGLAPYSPQKNNFSYYAWPARVIDYLACGLPVIITPVPLIAQKIAQKKAGILINYQVKELIKAIAKLMNDDQYYWQARRNTKKLVKDLNWNKIFKKAFNKIYE